MRVQARAAPTTEAPPSLEEPHHHDALMARFKAADLDG